MILNRNFTAQTSDWCVRNCVWGWPESCFETGDPLEGSDFGTQCSRPLLYCKSLDTLRWLLVGSRGIRWYSWLRHCATRWKDTGSIPDGVFGIFHWHKPFGCTMALGLTQPLTEISTWNISWGVQVASSLGWQPYHLHMSTVLKSRSLNLLEPSAAVQACSGIAVPLPLPSWFLPYPVQFVLHNHHLI